LTVPVDGLKRHFYRAILAVMKKASITEAKNNLSALDSKRVAHRMNFRPIFCGLLDA